MNVPKSRIFDKIFGVTGMRKNLVLLVAFSILFACAAFQKQAQSATTPDSNAPKMAVGNAASVAPPQKLMVPPMAYDDSSITVIWSKPSDYSNVVSYNVYQNGSLAGNTKNLFYNINRIRAEFPLFNYRKGRGCLRRRIRVQQ